MACVLERLIFGTSAGHYSWDLRGLDTKLKGGGLKFSVTVYANKLFCIFILDYYDHIRAYTYHYALIWSCLHH